MPWSEFLRYVAGPGVSLVVGVLISVIVEYWPAFDLLLPRWKRLAVAGFSFAVPVLATVLAVVSGEWGQWGDWAGTWWPALVSGFAALSAATLAHTRKLA
jgi:hypothetical protein